MHARGPLSAANAGVALSNRNEGSAGCCAATGTPSTNRTRSHVLVVIRSRPVTVPGPPGGDPNPPHVFFRQTVVSRPTQNSIQVCVARTQGVIKERLTCDVRNRPDVIAI